MTTEKRLNLGVTFHSFTNEFVTYQWSFEDLMYNASQLGGGVEIVGPVHHRKFPHVPAEFVTSFRNSVERHGLIPTSYGSYADPFMLWERSLTEDELTEYTIPQIEGAAKLGFPVVRLQHFASPIVERVLPLAERLGVTLGFELHAPLELESDVTRRLVEQIRRIGSPSLGLIPDMGIFAHSISAVRLDEALEVGISPALRDEIAQMWKDGAQLEAARERIERERAGVEAEEWVQHIWGSHGRSHPADLRDVFEHVVHVHAKFYSLVDGEEPDLRYRELVIALLDNDYRGWISAEYEGAPADSFEKVAGLQRLIRRYEAEHLAEPGHLIDDEGEPS